MPTSAGPKPSVSLPIVATAVLMSFWISLLLIGVNRFVFSS